MSNTIEITTTRKITVPENAVQVADLWFVPRENDASKKYAKVARIVEAVRDAQDDEGVNVPVEFSHIAAIAGEKYPQDVQASMQALEVLGMVEAFKVIDPNTGNPRASVYYRWVGANEDLLAPVITEDEDTTDESQDESSEQDTPNEA
jgi:hypothetical protein